MNILKTYAVLAVAPALLGAFATGQAHAAERRARLTVEVKIEGTEGVIGNGSDRTSGKFREGYTLVTYLKSDGELAQFNTKDPEYSQKMMGLAAAVQQKAQRAQGKPAIRRMTPAELQAYVQKKQAACAGDQACLYKLAQEVQQLSMNLDTGGARSRQCACLYRRRTAALI